MQIEPVMTIDEIGNKRWRLNGKLHRKDGPAIEWANGNKFWYLKGKLHREDGPAIEYADGDKHWYLNHRFYTFEEWIELTPLSDQEKVRLMFKFTSN